MKLALLCAFCAGITATLAIGGFATGKSVIGLLNCALTLLNLTSMMNALIGAKRDGLK